MLLSEQSIKKIDREVAKYPPDHKESAVMAALASEGPIKARPRERNEER